MILEMPQTPAWIAHLSARFDEAKMEVGAVSPAVIKTEVGLVDAQAKLSLSAAKLFAPSEATPAVVASSDPSQSLRQLVNEPIPAPGWVRRRDMAEDLANWLRATYHAETHAQLFCEAGLSASGDPHLTGKEDVVFHEGRPLLNVRIFVDVQRLATTIRSGRGWRFLGVVVSDSRSTDLSLPAGAGLFICDAYDKDSFVVARFET
jgi:hypothetical protein